MAIEKGLYSAPDGILEPAEEEGQELEIGILNPEMVTLDDGSMEITIVPDSGMPGDLAQAPFDANLAEYLDDTQLQAMSSELLGLVAADVGSRKEWADTFVKGLEVLGFKYEERTEPWENACGVYSTVLAEAAIRFQAEGMSETFPAAGPVKTQILGEITQDKEDAADRVKTDMNYELTDVLVEYRPEHERLLYSLGLAGSAFKKVYFDPNLGRQVAIFIPAEDMIVPYGASTLETAERVTHEMRKTKNELLKLQAAGFYCAVDLGDPQVFHTDVEEKKAQEGGYSLTDDDRYSLYEIHADLVIETTASGENRFVIEQKSTNSGIGFFEVAKPYVITIERGTGKVLGLRRNWNPDDPLCLKRQHFVHYAYVPGFGFYGLGLIHIIGGYARAGTSLIRQLVDAGTLSNLPGGLKARGFRVQGDDTPIGPGEFRDVDIPSGAIRDNIMPLPYKEPSQTLLALLNQITEEGRRLGAISDMNISDMSANAPVGTTLALLERTLKPMAAVQARVHYAMRQEFKLLRGIIAEYAPQEYEYTPDRAAPRARQADYATVEVIPVSDPNSTTMAQRVVQYQAVLQMAQGAPEIYDLPQLHRQMIEILGVKNADKLVPGGLEDMEPLDPVSENMNVLIGTPIQAFINQDHQAHLTTHQAFMADPMIAQQIGESPMASQMGSAMQAHMAEHLGFLYRQQMQEKLGVTLPPPNEPLPQDMEVQLSKLMADAGTQLTQRHEGEIAQQQAQEQAQDPIVQLKQAEMALKTQGEQRLKEKDAADIALAQERVDLDKKKVLIDAAKEGARIDAQVAQADQKADIDAAKTLLELAKAEKVTEEK